MCIRLQTSYSDELPPVGQEDRRWLFSVIRAQQDASLTDGRVRLAPSKFVYSHHLGRRSVRSMVLILHGLTQYVAHHCGNNLVDGFYVISGNNLVDCVCITDVTAGTICQLCVYYDINVRTIWSTASVSRTSVSSTSRREQFVLVGCFCITDVTAGTIWSTLCITDVTVWSTSTVFVLPTSLRKQLGRLFLHYRHHCGNNFVDCFCITDVTGGTIKSSENIDTFRQKLKTYLFKIAFPP